MSREPPTDTRRYEATLDLAAELDLQRAVDRGEHIRDPDAYQRRCRDKRASQHGPELRRLIANNPSWTPAQLVDTLDGQPVNTVLDPDQTTAMLEARQAELDADTITRAQADAAIANLDEHARAELRSRAEAEVPEIAGHRSEMLVAAAMRRIATNHPPT